ncbi:Kinase suppressor of Ras 2 [Anas platyrhynchos]|uniref:Kinase suppressor of Ras 2 n=1 Tax=Anas platyrhynchos TaxID=8839 RepID=R0J8U0_ANAPL|nr:Kinase suppressor of Ras 2 [Anas platyrhynchos]
MEEIAPGQLSLEELLEMTDDQVCETVEKFGANSEECARLNASLSCLRSVHKSGGSLSKQDWTIQWPTAEPGKENQPGCPPEPVQWIRTHLSQSPKPPPNKSHEFQLGHRVDEAHTPKVKKKNKPLNLKIHNSVGSCENIPSQRSPLLSERSLRSFFVGYPPFLPSTPPVHTDATFSANTLSVPRWSPQIPRRDLGNSIKHRFSTKYWMSQTCTVCGKGMLFGLKCKNCKLKCHNKCTKEAPPCHLLIIHRGARLVRTESVPCDINNPLRKPPRYSDLHVSQTLPKTNKLNKVSSAAWSPDPCPAATEVLLLPRCPTSLLHTPKGESPKSWWLLLGLQPPLVWIHPRAIPLLLVCVLSWSIRPLCYAALKVILKRRN